MACRGQSQRFVTIWYNQAQPPAIPTEDNTQASSIPSEDSLSRSLTCRSYAPTDGLEPSLVPAPPASTEELFKLFMQTYMDIVKNQAHVQAPVQVSTTPVEPKKQPLKACFPNLYFGQSHLNCSRFSQ